MADESFNQWRRTKQSSSEKQAQKQSWTYHDNACVTHSIEVSRKLKQVTKTLDDSSFVHRFVSPQPFKGGLPGRSWSPLNGEAHPRRTTADIKSSSSSFRELFDFSRADASELREKPRLSNESLQWTSNIAGPPIILISDSNGNLIQKTLHSGYPPKYPLSGLAPGRSKKELNLTQDVGVDTRDLAGFKAAKNTQAQTVMQCLKRILNQNRRASNGIVELDVIESTTDSEASGHVVSDVSLELEENMDESEPTSSESVHTSDILTPNTSDLSDSDFGNEPICSDPSDPLYLNLLFPSPESSSEVPEKLDRPSYLNEFSSDDVFARVSNNLRHSENSFSSANLDTLFGLHSCSEEWETESSGNEEWKTENSGNEEPKKDRKVRFSLEPHVKEISIFDGEANPRDGIAHDDFSGAPFLDGAMNTSEESNDCRLSSEGGIVMDSAQILWRSRKRQNDPVRPNRNGRKKPKKKPWKITRAVAQDFY